jgi:tRNA pseudouridine38-40 synthase
VPTQRYKLTVAYRGTAYYGWQTQYTSNTWKGPPPPNDELPTVQGVLRRALGGVLNHPVTIVGSSRTDSGVHAEGQVAHFDSDQAQIPVEGMRMAVNHQLPDDILVKSIEVAPPGFDAILWTVSKRYEYVVWNELNRDPFAADLAFHRWMPLDVVRMAEAAKYFEGTHDFASFAKPGHKRETTVRTVHSMSVVKEGSRIVIGVEGSGFLWHMVRIMAGTLIEVGIGKRFEPKDMAAMLAAKDRRAAGLTAPPHGLYLQWINYDEGSGFSGQGSPEEQEE